MKAWTLFLFLYLFQAINSAIAIYYIQDYSQNTVIIKNNALNNITTNSVVTSENQYLVTTMYNANLFLNALKILLSGFTPVGTYINSLFPGLLPSTIILLLDSVWAIIFGLSALEFIRGFKIIGG